MMDRNNSHLVKSLSVWRVNATGESFPEVHSRILPLLEAVYPGKWGQDILDDLVHKGWVKCTVYGTYVLTPEGIAEREKLSDSDKTTVSAPPQRPVKPGVKPWETFRKLVHYYADCVKMQERSQQYLFADDEGKKFFRPTLPHGWLKELGAKKQELSLNQNQENLIAINTILTRRSYEDEVYIGYPLEAFRSKGGVCYVPITLIPVDVRSDKAKLYLTPRFDEADINHAWLEYHVPKEDHKVLLDTLYGLHRDDEYCGLFDVEQALPFLERYAKGCTPGMFDPNGFDWRIPKPVGKQNVSWNCPVLFVGEEPKYSRTLLRELKYIARERDEVLDSTALAYVFRDPPLKPEASKNLCAHPFIHTNDEQQLAVTHALNDPVTVVTGPPGTGKSQVAVNIIANCVLYGKSVLFTSRNHKALHAIAERSTKLLEGQGVDLVHFCSTPDGQATDPWFRKDVPTILSQLEQLKENAKEGSYYRLTDLEKRWVALSQRLGERDELETKLSELQEQVEESEALSRHFLRIKDRTAPIAFPNKNELKRIACALADPPQGKGLSFWWRILLWKIRGEKRDRQARQKLSELIPDFVHAALPSSYFKEEVGRFLQKLLENKKLCRKERKVEEQCKKLFPIEEARACLQEDLECLSKENLISALLFSLYEAVKPFQNDPEREKQLRNLQSSFKTQDKLLQTQGVNSDQVAQWSIKFKQWLEIMPAWATTMLSLTRSAPCLPGVFDAVIIDEASQCDAPPMIPALYRAQRAVIVGDPQQFPPVITMRALRNEYLLREHQLNDERYAMYDYCQATAYNVAQGNPIMLTNHYRCHPDIADYFNGAFYGNRLNIWTALERLISPSAYGFAQAVDWENVKDSVEDEIAAVVKRVSHLAKNGYPGSVGVITPLRHYADILDEKLNPWRHSFKEELIVNTVNGFQGGEKDVIILMLSYTSQLRKNQVWYVTAEENRYIYNVAVSRARACLVLVGDRERCAGSTCSDLRKLAALPYTKKIASGVRMFDSVWEERLYNALIQDPDLQKAGIMPQPQYHVVGRRLDLAVITDTVKLDIEVDGVRWHTSRYGGRKADDLWRDIQVTSAGWEVLRFWVYQLREDMPACVAQIKEALGVN